MLFKRASLEVLERGVIDGIYIGYRALFDMEQEKMDVEALYLMREMVDALNKIIAKRSSELLEAGHASKVQLLKLSEEALRKLELDEDRQPVIEVLHQELMKAYQDDGNLNHLKEALDLKFSVKIFKTILGDTILNALDKVTDVTYDGDLVAAAMMIDVLSNYNEAHVFGDDALQRSELEELKTEPKGSNPQGSHSTINVDQYDAISINKLMDTAIHLIREISLGTYNPDTTEEDIVALIRRYNCNMVIF